MGILTFVQPIVLKLTIHLWVLKCCKPMPAYAPITDPQNQLDAFSAMVSRKLSVGVWVYGRGRGTQNSEGTLLAFRSQLHMSRHGWLPRHGSTRQLLLGASHSYVTAILFSHHVHVVTKLTRTHKHVSSIKLLFV